MNFDKIVIIQSKRDKEKFDCMIENYNNGYRRTGKIIVQIDKTKKLDEETFYSHFDKEKCKALTFLSCQKLNLKELFVPPTVIELHCNDNKLTQLELPNGLKKLDCSNNRLTNLNVPPNMEIIRLSNNKFTDKPLIPQGCEEV